MTAKHLAKRRTPRLRRLRAAGLIAPPFRGRHDVSGSSVHRHGNRRRGKDCVQVLGLGDVGRVGRLLITDGLGGDRQYFDRNLALREHEGIDYHRRSGRIDEWRELLTAEQVDRINRMIPDRLWNLFGWEP